MNRRRLLNWALVPLVAMASPVSIASAECRSIFATNDVNLADITIIKVEAN